MTAQSLQTTFLTGATGFLGHFVLRELLCRGRRVVVLLRPGLDASLERLAGLMRPLEIDVAEQIDAGRLVAAEGTLPDGLPDPAWGETDDILSCAASLQLFTNGSNDPFRTNVEGTQALIGWAQRNGVTNIHAVSTAYVCGMSTGRIGEAFHTPEPDFQTDYERSKWQAERELSRWGESAGRSLTIHRPSFVIGESTTGYTTQYGGFYQFARLVSMLNEQNGHAAANSDRHVPLRIPLDPSGCQNLVPVDYVARMIAACVCAPAMHGRIYHLTDPQPPTIDFWKGCFEDCFHVHGGFFVDPRNCDGARSTEEAMVWEQIDVLLPRLRHTVEFDQTNALRLMDACGVAFPSLNRDRAVRILNYAASTAWGKRSNGVATVPWQGVD